MADTVRAATTASLRRDAILEAVAYAAERLLLSAEWRDTANDVLERLGVAADVSRAYFLENTLDAQGRLCVTQTAEWCAPGIESQTGNPILQSSPWIDMGFERWVHTMTRGEMVQGVVADFPESEREELQAQSILSVVAFPVTVDVEWWGCVGFDECTEVREWGSAELDALRAAATLIGAAIQRQRSDEQRRAAERRYRNFVEQIPAVTYTDVPGDVVRMGFVSPQIQAILGLPPAAFLEDPRLWASLIHPDDYARLISEDAFNPEDLSPFDEEYRMRVVDGTWIWVHDTSIPVMGDDGRVEYFQGFMTDVTERKWAEESLRQAEERFRVLVEQMPAVTYTESVAEGTSTATHMDYISPQALEVFGYPLQRWLDDIDFWATICHPDDVEHVRAGSAAANATGMPFSVDFRVIAADGRGVWIHEEAILVGDTPTGPRYWQGFMLDVTERKLAEEQIRIAEEKFRTIVENTPAITYQEIPTGSGYDATSTISYVSPHIKEILGYTPEEWAAAPGYWAGIIHPDDVDAVMREGERTTRSGEPYRQDYRMIAKDGRVVWFHDESHLIRDADGNPLLWQGVMLDITDRKEAEERLRHAQERLEALIEHIPAVVYIESPSADPTRFYLSPQVQQIFGHTQEAWTWTPDFWIDHVHPEDREAVETADRLTDDTLNAYSMDYRFLRSDGTYVWVHDEAVFVASAEEEGFWQGFLFDITEQKAAEDQLREAEEKYRTIVEQNPAVIYTQEVDPDDPSVSRTTYISPKQDELFGYSVEDVLADPVLWMHMVHPDDVDRVMAADLSSNTSDEGRFSLEYRMIAKDGRIVWVHDQAVLVQIGDRTPFWQGFLLDITERKHAQEQLERALTVEREATKRLRALDDMKNTFLQAVSHDLRTPLAAILGLAITLERGDVHLEEDDARDLARRIADNARRLDRLVTNLLDLDRLARGIVAPKLQPTDVGSLVRRVVAESELIADSRLHTDIQPVVVPADAAKVERIVENLLANTARHTPGSARVWVSVRPQPDGVLLRVDDEGDGVAEDLRETIFEPFQQGPDAPQHSPGVGVGLTLVRRFAELHGGRAWVEARTEGGASFRVFLPSEPQVPSETPSGTDPDPPEGSGS